MVKTLVSELIEELQDYDQDAEVFIGSQPSYPFKYCVDSIGEDDNGNPIILEGYQKGYGSKSWWSE